MKKTILACLLLAAIGAQAQNDLITQPVQVPEADNYTWPTEKDVLAKLSQWQDLKFGVLMHWGIYSVPGIVESWSICDEDWITRDTTRTYQQYKQWYWGLSEDFNPTRFDPAQWARVMRDAGMRYMIFTTKHHDGFCLWNSRLTDYTVARHAFRNNPRRDVLRWVLDAFRRQNFMIGEYFSKPDWHSQDYWWDVHATRGRNVNYNIAKFPWHWERFKRFTHGQIEEILSDYGTVDILWLDGGWVCKENNQDIDMPAIAAMARRLQPGILIVDRTIAGPYENYQTPERGTPEGQVNHPWESCIPLSDDWGWTPNARFKSARQVVNTLAEIVAKGGNLVLGVGPSPEGVIIPEVTDILHQIGQWLNQNGEAIYGTVTTPHFHQGNLWFTASKDGNRVYAIYALPDGEQLPATLTWSENIPAKGGQVKLLSTGQTLPASVADGQVTVTLPAALPQQSIALCIEVKNQTKKK